MLGNLIPILAILRVSGPTQAPLPRPAGFVDRCFLRGDAKPAKGIGASQRMTTRPPISADSDALIAQEKLVPFLLNPRSYPHRPRRVELIQTHSSFVFVAPPFVYKVKKPVNFGFLDFSTLEKRRHFCEREVTLNRRLCPRTYLGVVPICSTGIGYQFGDSGRVVEYAVKMRRLGPGRFLDQRVDQGKVRSADLDRVTRVLRDFYQSQHPTPEIEAWGRIRRLRISTEENFRQAAEFIGHTLSQAAFETIRDFTRESYRLHRTRFESRIRHGWIRDCHGDLHLDHVHLTERDIQIFDCIEFNDRFRYVDVANDVAFLAMDLDFHQRPDLARRGKVESLHSVAHAAPAAEREATARRARRYFQLSLQYATIGSSPAVVVVMGRIGSGKSTLARALANALGWPVVSSDAIRKALAGLPLYKRSPAATRAQLYSHTMGDRTYRRLFQAAVDGTREGHGIVLDATFSHPDQRRRLRDLCVSRQLPYEFIEVSAPDSTVRRRLWARESGPDELSDARLEDFEALSRIYHPPVEIPAAHRLCVDSSRSVDVTVRRLLRMLSGRRLSRER